MPVLVNFKICDNAKECSGLAVCPTGALTYDEKEKTLLIDNNKCISCGKCEKECPIGAISVAKTKEEYEKIKNEIDNDTRNIKDLFVDRYGATPLSDFFLITPKELEEKTKTQNIVLVECYTDDSIECLLKSIPIKELTQNLPDSTLFYKVESDDTLIKKYHIDGFPTLLLFRNGKLLNKISGYYTIEEKDKLIQQIEKILY